MNDAQPSIGNRLRLNLGSGKWNLEGWYNIDAIVSPLAQRQPDLICDLRSIPLPDGCAIEAMAIHVWEHIDRWECDRTIDEWARLLRKGATLILEMPDLLKCCRNVLDGVQGKKPDQLGMWGLYGEPVGAPMQHKWGWTFTTLRPFLERHGFVDVHETRTQFHQSGRDVRDFRVEARKA